MAFLAEPKGWLHDRPLRFDRSFDDCQELERLGVRAYEDGDLRLAHFLIDRIRRIGVARAELLCLKADLLARLGFERLSAQALDIALELDPDNLHANTRLVGSGEDATERVRAADRLIRLCPDNERTLGLALKVLKEADRAVVATGQIVANEFIGWVVWNGADSVDLIVSDGGDSRTVTVWRESRPAWARHFSRFAPIRFPIRADDRPVHLSIDWKQSSLCRVSSYPAERRRPLVEPQPADAAFDADLTVIAPIYKDFEATRDCLDSLRSQLDPSRRVVAVLVDDATPDDRIRQLLQDVAGDPAFTVVHNETNLGFAGAVNRALSMVPYGDVIVLNADTVLPAGAINELARAGRSSPDIGTVTPLSNNGEYTSFPEPFRVNDLPSADMIAAIHQAAAINRDVLVDLPNGIGFCLYVTRRCLDSVGGMPQLYDRGYFEDVEFCLRARQSGLRNVCAPSIYVGHVGSRSFGDEKRSLVMRNLKKLQDRFPEYNNESAAFTTQDPLRDARGKIEKQLLRDISFDRLLLAPDDLVGEIATARAKRLSENGAATLLCILSAAARTATFRFARTNYQSLTFSIGSTQDIETLVAYIADLKVERHEFAGSSGLLIDLAQRLKPLHKPSDIFVADAGCLDLRRCLDGTDKPARSRRGKEARGSASSSPRVARYIAPNKEARAFLESERIHADRIDAEPDRTMATSLRATFSDSRTINCGVVLDERCPSDFRSFVDLTRRLSRVPSLRFYVLGRSVDDDALMASGNVFALGPTDDDEITTLAEIYRLEKMMIYVPRPVFAWSKAQRAWEAGLPTARFAWPFTPAGARGSLRMDPSQPTAELADQLTTWLIGASCEAIDAA